MPGHCERSEAIQLCALSERLQKCTDLSPFALSLSKGLYAVAEVFAGLLTVGRG